MLETEDASEVLAWGRQLGGGLRGFDIQYYYLYGFGHGDYETTTYGLEDTPTGASYVADSTGTVDSVMAMLSTNSTTVDSTFPVKLAIYKQGTDGVYDLWATSNEVTYDESYERDNPDEPAFVAFTFSSTVNIGRDTNYAFILCVDDVRGSETVYLHYNSAANSAAANDSLIYGTGVDYASFPEDPLDVTLASDKAVSLWVSYTSTEGGEPEPTGRRTRVTKLLGR